MLAGLMAVVTVALAAALQAVDGVALKSAVDRWASSPEGAHATAFEAAYAIRQIEIGFASLMEVVSSVAVLLYGIALLSSPAGAAWLGVFGVLFGMASLFSGLVKAHSDSAMMASMPSSLLLLAWSI